MKKIISFGELLWDCYPDNKYIGGAPFNFAAHCAMLGNEAYILTALGNDELGDCSLKALADFGVNSQLVSKNSYPTGQCIVTLNDGIPSYNVLGGVAYDNIVYDACLKEKLNKTAADCFYFGTVAQRNSVSAAALEKILENHRFGLVFSDINLRPDSFTYDTVLRCLTKSDVLKISREEMHFLWEMGLVSEENEPEKLAKCLSGKYKNLKKIIITLDSEGALGFDCETNEAIFAPSVPCTVASTVGAGDSFSAACISALLNGKSFKEALENGAKVASFVVSKTEAVPKYSKNITE